jgi:MoaA/NifB/PqqE/SkfB family radical SAM enzyme
MGAAALMTFPAGNLGEIIVPQERIKNVEINPGRLCNNKCIFCMSGEDRDDHNPWASIKRVFGELDHHYKNGARSVGFLGGEPTAYPHIIEAIAHAKKLGYQRISLCTNAMRLSQSEFFRDALDAGLTRATVSLHSHISEVEERLVGVPRILEMKLKAIENLVAARDSGRLPDNVSLNPVLNRLNAPLMEGYIQFFILRGINDIRFNFIWPQSRVLKDTSVVPRFRDVIADVLKVILRNERQWKISITFGAIPFCVVPDFFQKRKDLLFKYFSEEANDHPTDVGFINPDEEGTVNRFTLKARTRYDHRMKLPVCRNCRFDSECLGIWRSYIDLYGSEEFSAA